MRTSFPIVPAMGLLTSELCGLTPGESGLMLMGDVWLMGDRSLLAGVPIQLYSFKLRVLMAVFTNI